jgi:uncharacterized membrane protein
MSGNHQPPRQQMGQAMKNSRTQDNSSGLRVNRGLLWLTRHWLRVALVIIGVYAGLPWVAPTLMKLGLTDLGNAIYTIYSPMCHQFAFRSVFLYGDQPFYPREAVGSEYKPFDDYAFKDAKYQSAYAYWYEQMNKQPFVGDVTRADLQEFTIWMQFAARDFRGNEQMGYKTSLCARDVAIYAALFFGGCLYAIPQVRRRLRPMPLILYVLIGLGPIGLDGFSQLLGYPPFNFWQVRETAPFFRIVTGALFGLMNAWLAFPYIESSMRDTRRQLLAKMVRAGVEIKLK